MPTNPEYPTVTAATPVPCTFPDGAWDPYFRALVKAPAPLLPSGWQTQLTLPPPPDQGPDCAQVAALSGARTQADEGHILAQAVSDTAAVQPVQDIIGNINFPPLPAAKAMVMAVLENVVGPMFVLKQQINRGRPYHCCAETINAMFLPGSAHQAYHPAHPSYPSGHATQAFAVALVYADLYPTRRAELLAAAKGVADNRVIAGLHYPSDGEAGLQLAAQVVAWLLADRRFIDLKNRAKDALGPREAEVQAVRI